MLEKEGGSKGHVTVGILKDPDFIDLVQRKNRVSLILTVVQLILYFGFIGLIAFNKPFLGTKMGDSPITIGIPMAVGVIFLSWVLTGVYIRWANNRYDNMVAKLKQKAGA